jgi:flagellar basal body P-ring protein FlgI
VILLLMGAIVMLGACAKPPERPASTVQVPVQVRDTQSILRGTIGAEVSIRGTEGTIVSGYGLVVGLDGTGSGIVPIGVRSVLEQEMLQRGVGQGSPERGPLARVSPSQLIDSPNTAVVLVQAFIPAGLPLGATFDVEVSALNGSGVTSLEGGRLYTTDLRRGVVSPSAPDTRAVAQANGPVFINPFATDESDTAPSRSAGRVLGGGRVTLAEPVRLLLDTPSHARAREITRAINNRFRTSSNTAVAVGRSEELIQVNIPPNWRENPSDFLNLLRFTRVDQTFPEEWARRYTTALVEQPELATQLAWCLKALGSPAAPFLRPLYDHPESAPRLAAIEAGAWIGDLLVRPHLEDLIQNGPAGLRATALGWMTRLPIDRDPGIRDYIASYLDHPDIVMRIAAYEALRDIKDVRVITRLMGDKFALELVPSSVPTIYVTQSNTRRVVLFGLDMHVLPNSFVDVWNGRLLLKFDPGESEAEIFYRPNSRANARTIRVDGRVANLIRRLSFEPTPDVLEDGLGMQYSEIVTVLYRLADSGAVAAIFFPEDDRENIENIRRLASRFSDERPGLAPDDADPFEPRAEDMAGEPEEAERSDSPFVVPLPRPEPVQPRRDPEDPPG